MKIKIYIEAEFDSDTPNELHDEQVIHEIVDNNIAVLCKELDLTDVHLTQFDVVYDDES